MLLASSLERPFSFLVNRRKADVSFGNLLSANSSILAVTHHTFLWSRWESPTTELWGRVAKFQEREIVFATLLAYNFVSGFKTVTELSRSGVSEESENRGSMHHLYPGQLEPRLAADLGKEHSSQRDCRRGGTTWVSIRIFLRPHLNTNHWAFSVPECQ